jgi:hypothetical protein
LHILLYHKYNTIADERVKESNNLMNGLMIL